MEKADSSRGSFVRNYWKVLLSAGMLAGGMVAHAAEAEWFRQPAVMGVWYLLAYLPVGLPVMREAWESMREHDYFSEFTLMTLATFGAFYIGEYPEGVAVMLFYSIGELFQDKAVDRAKRNISELLDVRPEKALVVTREGTEAVSPRLVPVGSLIEVKTGERIPLDGTLENERASFNTAALTGESRPRTIRAGGEVLAGMIVTDRVIHLRVIRPYDKSALARILELVQNASERKAPAELFIRKFARIYTPTVIVLALLIVCVPWVYSGMSDHFVFDFDNWLYRALVFLVISCPCALVVSIPLGYFGGIGAASRLGILFKGGNYLDAITQVNTVIFDKTGTLTKGTFEVQSCHVHPAVTEEQLVRWVASVEAGSTHPIAKAVVTYAQNRQVGLLPVDQVEELAGYGLRALLAGSEVLVGNTRLLDKSQVAYPKELSEIVDTVVVCAVEGRYAGYLLLSDTLKEDAFLAIKKLKALSNIDHIQILSGDKQAIVTEFGKRLGVDQAYGDLLPEGKVQHLEALRKDPTHRIAFVGDGMNDAPVLALSHVGIAMGGLGSDAAIETADVVIQNDRPSRVADAIRVGQLTRHIVWENILLALGIKLLVLFLGALGMANLWEAVFADVGVTILAVLNAIRIQGMIRKI